MTTEAEKYATKGKDPEAEKDAYDIGYQRGFDAALQSQQKLDIVTVKNISEYIERWRFDEDIEGAFGAYLMKLHPHGFKIVGG